MYLQSNSKLDLPIIQYICYLKKHQTKRWNKVTDIYSVPDSLN